MKHLPEHFRPPEMHARQDAEHNAADNDIVEMRYDKIRIVELIICRRGRQHDTRDSSEYERRNKGDGIQHRRSEFDVSSQMVKSQLKILMPVGTAIAIVATANIALAIGPSPVVNIW